MKNLALFIILVTLLNLPAWSAVTPEKILPINTFAVVTVPDLNAARKLFKADPLSLMWNDPSMAAFTGKIEEAFRENVMDRIREEASVDPAEIWNLAQRQVTIALTRQPDQLSPGVILLVDSGKKIAELDRGMLLLREALADNQVEHERLRIEATDFLRMPFPGRNEAAFYLGQSKSMFIITNSEQLAETVVKNHKKPKANALLRDNPAFAIQHKAQFAGAWMYGWLDFSTVLEVVNHEIEKRRDPDAEPNPLMPEPKRVMEALGLTGLKDVGISGRTDDGMLFEINMNVPEVARRGLFSMIAPENKEAGPPPFVPSDVVSFGRLRQSAAHIWKTFVETANEITPAAAGAMAFFQAQIQTKNPDFKLKAQLIDTMGDDFIMIEMAPRGLGLKDMISPPRLYLINSKKPKVTLRALMDIISMVIDAPPEEEEIEGRTLYSYNFGNFIDNQEASVHMMAVGEYVMFSQDLKAMKQYLDGPEEEAKPLAKFSGLNQAAKKVGGMDSGAFGFENTKIMAQGVFTMLKKNPDLILNAFRGRPQGIDPDTGLPVQEDRIGEWLDFQLLPEFKQISKYFNFSVVGVRADKQGIRMGIYIPTAPASK